jgi:hypothetical protein
LISIPKKVVGTHFKVVAHFVALTVAVNDTLPACLALVFALTFASFT